MFKKIKFGHFESFWRNNNGKIENGASILNYSKKNLDIKLNNLGQMLEIMFNSFM
jgi:hypothetical protein